MSHKCVAQQVVAYESLKTKEKTSMLVIPKSGPGRLGDLLITEFEWQFKQGLIMVV